MSAWLPGDPDNPVPAPSYTTPIKIIDWVLPTLPRTELVWRRRWRKAVQYALMEWSRSGVPFVYERRDMPRDRFGNIAHWVIEANAINLGNYPTVWPWSAPYVGGVDNVRAYGGFNSSLTSVKGGYGVFDMDWMKHVRIDLPDSEAYDWRHIITHEIGHALGFGHGDKRDGAWMMGAGKIVCSPAELEAVREYYT